MKYAYQIACIAIILLIVGCSNQQMPTDPNIVLEHNATMSIGNIHDDIFLSGEDDDCGEGKERQLSSISFDKMIDCLGLSESQKAALNALKIDNNNACKSENEKLKEAKNKALKAFLDEEAKCKASGKSDSEKRSIYERLKKIYNEATTKAEAAYKSSLKNHNKKFYDTFCTILTPEQIAKLNLWLSGKNPCGSTSTGGSSGSGTISSGTGSGTGTGDTGTGGGTGTGIGSGG